MFRDFFERHKLGGGVSFTELWSLQRKVTPGNNWQLVLLTEDGEITGYVTVAGFEETNLAKHMSAVTPDAGKKLFDWVERDGPVKWI